MMTFHIIYSAIFMKRIRHDILLGPMCCVPPLENKFLLNVIRI